MIVGRESDKGNDAFYEALRDLFQQIAKESEENQEKLRQASEFDTIIDNAMNIAEYWPECYEDDDS